MKTAFFCGQSPKYYALNLSRNQAFNSVPGAQVTLYIPERILLVVRFYNFCIISLLSINSESESLFKDTIDVWFSYFFLLYQCMRKSKIKAEMKRFGVPLDYLRMSSFNERVCHLRRYDNTLQLRLLSMPSAASCCFLTALCRLKLSITFLWKQLP